MPARMLLAEDSVTIRRIIELTFANEDVTIVSVSDSESAIQQIRRIDPVVLADVSMPKLDGWRRVVSQAVARWSGDSRAALDRRL